MGLPLLDAQKKGDKYYENDRHEEGAQYTSYKYTMSYTICTTFINSFHTHSPTIQQKVNDVQLLKFCWVNSGVAIYVQ